jgi:ribonucleoside-triphosphate reductase (thioredoxin)
MKFPIEQTFKLTDNFLEKYKNKRPNFGFNGLGEFVYLRTYSRIKEDGKNEMWWETVRRVVEGIYAIQKQHIEDYNLGWNSQKAQKSAQEMYDRIFSFKMLPAGRSLWSMGAPVVMEKGLTQSLYNCSFLSTESLKEDPGKPFANAMDFLMCGIGVGADLAGANKIKVREPGKKSYTYVIPDSREGWVESLYRLINSYFGDEEIFFDYSYVREAGKPIKNFGGTASGPAPLKELHEKIRSILDSRIGEFLTATDITDIFNLIGKCVVAGNVRRSAEIILGEADQEFLDLKNYEKHPERIGHGWASNNSIFANLGMDYTDVAERIKNNGEPGLLWLDNAQKYGRMIDSEADYKDFRVKGLNPCAEITLEPGELCNLCETFPNLHEDFDDYAITIKFAYLYAKTITLLGTNWTDTNRPMLRNRRIGLSMTGIAQFISDWGIDTLKNWMIDGFQVAKKYDKIYSEWFAIPESIKITTIKPSGTLSLLAGATPGIHYPESQYYIRRVRLANDSPFIPILKESGYKIELAVGQEESTSVVEFPVCVGENVRTLKDVSMWEQLSLAAMAQKYWADNSVSATITFDPNTEGNQIKDALNLFQYQLKAISFLPRLEQGAYAQMPYEEITKEQYEDMAGELMPLDFINLFSAEAVGEKYCSNDTCEIL